MTTDWDKHRNTLKAIALRQLAGGFTKTDIITQTWGYDGSDINEGLDIWRELGLDRTQEQA